MKGKVVIVKICKNDFDKNGEEHEVYILDKVKWGVSHAYVGEETVTGYVFTFFPNNIIRMKYPTSKR